MDIAWIGTAFVGLVGSITTYLGIRGGKRGDRENALIDQLQEERKLNSDELQQVKKRVSSLESTVYRLLSRDALWRIHSDFVEAQVVDLGGVPRERPPALLVDISGPEVDE